MLLPSPGTQLIQIGPELDCDLATFGARASKLIVELLRKCGSWPKTGIVRVVYRDFYVSSPLAARLLIDTMQQIFPSPAPRRRPSSSRPVRRVLMTFAVILGRFGTIGATRPIRKRSSNCLGSSAALTFPCFRRMCRTAATSMSISLMAAATIVLDQGFGAWAPPREVTVRYDFAPMPPPK